MALVRERQRQLTLDVNTAIGGGEFEKALGLLRASLHSPESTPDLAAAEHGIEALIALRDYTATPAPKTADQAEEALSAIAARPSLSDSPRFRSWLAVQQQRLERMRENERRQLLSALLEAYDRAVVTGRSRADTVLAQLRRLAPDHPVVQLATGALAPDGSAFRDVAKSRARGKFSAALEMVACRYWFDLNDETRTWLAATMTDVAPSTLAGLLLHAFLALEQNRPALVVKQAGELTEVAPVDSVWTRLMLENAVMDREQFHAGCWRAPCPAVTDFLNRITQLREQMKER
jgi:hypothetical protein